MQKSYDSVRQTPASMSGTTREVIKAHPNVSEAYVLRGIALLFSADLDQVGGA